MGQNYLTDPHVFDLTGMVEVGEKNLIAIQIDRVGNDEIYTGGLMNPSFIFIGPRVETPEADVEDGFRVVPGGEFLRDH